MRFHRFESRLSREWTRARLAAARHLVQREQDSMALFPELAKYQTLEDRIKAVDTDETAFIRQRHDHHAASWRKA